MQGKDFVFRASTFNFDLTFLLDEAGAIFHVPAEGVKKGIQKIVAQLRFGVAGLFEFRETLAEGFDEPVQFFLEGFKAGGVRHGA